ncbi:MAG TPA: rhodanese-like domain-containing protein [Ktedonobacteraceae bacterium]|jgi:rhodanese-related sulfurtransferase/glyoxylase-like metal-dependent hydrolase (beta-lactamase superfamily II)
MYFKQLVKEDLGCASYIVGCSSAGICAVVDPRLDMVDDILTLTSTSGLQVSAVIETHTHADHVSGHGELAERTGACIYVHALADVAFPHRQLLDGDELAFGVVKLCVVHTPGHRPEHIALAVSDTSRSQEPWLVLTGDSLFIGDVARPDLAVPGVEGARALYESLFNRLLCLDDGVEIYPAHVAGSLCGRAMNAKTSSTIGFERRHNAALTPASCAAFVQALNEHLPRRPPNMQAIVERNRADYTHRAPVLTPCVLSPAAVRQQMEAGALALDIRTPESFAAGHIPRALHVSVHGSAFATRVGFVAPSTASLLLIGESEAELAQALVQLAVVGYDHVHGLLAEGIEAWRQVGFPVETLKQLSVVQLKERQPALHILDVRDPEEWEAGHIEGAMHLPFDVVEQRYNELDACGPLAVICGSGQRSTIAAAVLMRHGFAHLYNVVGGMQAWEEAGLPQVR